MISLNVQSTDISKLRAIDEWIGENVVRGRPEGEEAYRITGNTYRLIAISFLYPEDEVAFKLTFAV